MRGLLDLSRHVEMDITGRRLAGCRLYRPR